MRCQLCGQVAVISMPQHRLKLCEEHFLAWVERRVARTIESLEMFAPDDRLLVAVSGGKDSLTLWEILLRLGYRADGLYINLGIGHESYSDVSQARAEAFAAMHPEATLHVVNVAQRYGRSIPDLAHGRGHRVCSRCGMVKRYIMNRSAREGGYAVLATGHNLDDEAAQLLQNNLYWVRGYLQRQAPVLPEAAGGGLARKAKPLCLLYERESAAYALVRGIDYVQQECPYARRATSIFHKHILNDLERRSPGTKLQYYLGFVRARQDGFIVPEELEAGSGVCQRCGQPTTANEICAFCRMLETEGLL